MAKRKLEEINAGSMADIAFLLLAFFIVATTLDRDTGIEHTLPPIIENPPAIESRMRDILSIQINKDNRLFVENDYAEMDDITGMVEKFYLNWKYNDQNMPVFNPISPETVQAEIKELKDKHLQPPNYIDYEKQIKKLQEKKKLVEMLGDNFQAEIFKRAMIVVKYNKQTSYETFIVIKDKIQLAIDKLRNNLSLKAFGVPFASLDQEKPEDYLRIKAIRLVYPYRVLKEDGGFN